MYVCPCRTERLNIECIRINATRKKSTGSVVKITELNKSCVAKHGIKNCGPVYCKTNTVTKKQGSRIQSSEINFFKRVHMC